MMDHIINFDWNYREPEEYFIRPEDLDNSVTERILRNKFRDPLISSDEEGDDKKAKKINWNEIVAKAQKDKHKDRVYVPGLMKPPQYLKLSSLTYNQHKHCLKVICAKEPHILPAVFMPRPTKLDLTIMEEVRETYEKEQKEFIEWAKLLWTTDHCRRALRPKPRVETLYEALFKIRTHEMQTFPINFWQAAQIPLETMNENQFEIVHQKDLITVNIDELPEVECPLEITGKLSIMKPLPVPESCPQHTCKFVLPNEHSVTEKSLVEVHRSLAQFACDHRAGCIAGEEALCCLLEQDRSWMLAVSVVDMFGADGEPCNVIVFGNEFATLKEAAPLRNYRAFKDMLDIALVSDTEMSKLRYSKSNILMGANKDSEQTSKPSIGAPSEDLDSSDDENMMVIDTGETDVVQASSPRACNNKISNICPRKSPRLLLESKKNTDEQIGSPDQASEAGSETKCTCKGTIYERPPPRSYRKWKLRNKTTDDDIDIIVHCAHRLKQKGVYNELILEPIPEYQLDLGASEQPQGKITSLALALMLHKNATLANVRMNGVNGDVVRFECYTAGQYTLEHGEQWPRIANVLHSTVAQLQGLLPGHYVLKHDIAHGANALLLAARGRRDAAPLRLLSEPAPPDDALEALSVSTPPKLSPVLLPMHKHKTILPLAFTHSPRDVAPESKKPVTRTKPPPQALQWPKRQRRKRKKKEC